MLLTRLPAIFCDCSKYRSMSGKIRHMRDRAYGWLVLWSYNDSPSFKTTIHVDCPKLIYRRAKDTLRHLANRALPGKVSVCCPGSSASSVNLLLKCQD